MFSKGDAGHRLDSTESNVMFLVRKSVSNGLQTPVSCV